jgi:hypothetical protein
LNRDLRTALLIGGLIFVGGFAAMTVAIAAQYGIDVLTFAAAAIILMLGLALIGAIRDPPEE